jgi:chromosome segregation ATPase
VATDLRPWDSPSSRAAAAGAVNSAITGLLAKQAQDSRNRRLKRAVKRTGFEVKQWQSRVTARASALEDYANSLQRAGASLQSGPQQVESLSRSLEGYTAQWQTRIDSAPDPQAARKMQRQYRQGYKQRATVIKDAAAQHQAAVQKWESQKAGLKPLESRYKGGVKQAKQAVQRNKQAVRRYKDEYYPVQP